MVPDTFEDDYSTKPIMVGELNHSGTTTGRFSSSAIVRSNLARMEVLLMCITESTQNMTIGFDVWGDRWNTTGWGPGWQPAVVQDVFKDIPIHVLLKKYMPEPDRCNWGHHYHDTQLHLIAQAQKVFDKHKNTRTIRAVTSRDRTSNKRKRFIQSLRRS